MECWKLSRTKGKKRAEEELRRRDTKKEYYVRSVGNGWYGFARKPTKRGKNERTN